VTPKTSIDPENLALNHSNKLHFRIFALKKQSIKIVIIFLNINSIVDQTNAALVRIGGLKIFLKNITEPCLKLC